MRLAESAAAVAVAADLESAATSSAASGSAIAGGLDDLRKALDSGQMSLLDYMNEIGYFYSSRELALQTRLEYMLAVADLLALEM